jgi:hypothetical protein
MSSAPVLSRKKKTPDESVVELESFKKQKSTISTATAKRIIGRSVDTYGASWIERWIENWIRGNSMPPQLLSNDFPQLMPSLLTPTHALAVFDTIRTDFNRAFPLPIESLDDSKLDWIVPVLRADPVVVNEYPIILNG